MARKRRTRNPRRNIRKRSGRVVDTPKPRAYPTTSSYVTTIVIAGYPVHVFKIPEFPDPLQVGEFEENTQEIYIKQDLPSSVAEADTLLHEVLHAINRLALIQEDRMTERQVATISTLLVDTLARNPTLRLALEERLQGEISV